MNDIDKLKHDSLQLYLDAERRVYQNLGTEGLLSEQAKVAYNRFQHDLCYDSIEELLFNAVAFGALYKEI